MYAKYIKRLLDIVLSLIAIIVLSPVYLIVAIVVRIQMGSPVLFSQDRIGKDEKVFNAFFEALGKAASDPKYKSDTNQNAFYSAEGCVNVDKTNLPQAGDKVVVLSVCKNGDDNHRYLIMAKMVEDSAEPIVMTKEEAEAAGVTADRILDKDALTDKTDASNKTDAAAKTDTSAKTDKKS